MQKYIPLRKGTAVVVLALFIGVSTIPSTLGVDKSPMPIFDDPTIVSILPSSQAVEQGESFIVSVYIEPGEPIIGVSFDYLFFDPTLIHANSVIQGNLFDPWPWFFGCNHIDNVNGKIICVWGLTIPAVGVTDSGYLCNISFTAQQNDGISLLDLEGVIVANETGGEVPLIINDGVVTVGEPNNPPNTPSQPDGPDFVCLWLGEYFSTFTTDPDDDNVSYGWDWDGDLVVDEWTGWYESGDTCTVFHGWYQGGEYYVRVKARDTFENESGWSDPLFVDVGSCWPPYEPGYPDPEDGETDVDIDVILSWWAGDPLPGAILTYDIYFGTNPDPPYVETIGPYPVGENTWYDPGTLEYNTTYYWQIVVCHWGGSCSWGPPWDFTTMGIPPEITNVMLTTSEPLDTQPGFGWENITCTVTDDTEVYEVKLVLIDYGPIEYHLINIPGTDIYYYNTTFTIPGYYNYYIWANDTSGNENVSEQYTFWLPSNCDIDMNGIIHFMDFIAVSMAYNEEGSPGWIREDLDNNGKVHFMDLIYLVIYCLHVPTH